MEVAAAVRKGWVVAAFSAFSSRWRRWDVRDGMIVMFKMLLRVRLSVRLENESIIDLYSPRRSYPLTSSSTALVSKIGF